MCFATGDGGAGKLARQQAEEAAKREQDARAKAKADRLDERTSQGGGARFSALARAAFQPVGGTRSFFTPLGGS